MDRGGPIPTFAAPRQQQFGDQHVATPPPPTRADGQPGGPPSAHPSAQARGGGCGMTVKQRQQQQQTPARSPTEQARLANCLYRQCVAAGLWAKISVEQRPDGEHISFFSRPSAAASTAARAQEEVGPRRRRRRPNQKRRLKKKLWMQSRDQLRQPSRPTATPGRASGQQHQLQAVAAVLGTYAQIAACPRAPVPAATAAVTPEVAAIAAAAASPKQLGVTVAPVATVAVVATSSCSPVISPRMTRSKKRRKELSPGDFDAVCQLDGADASPPTSPPEPTIPAASPGFAAFPELHLPPETPGEIESTVTLEKEEVPPQKEVVVSSLTRSLDAFHREAHAGLIVEGCDRCTRKN